jgi:hypothetical protein
VLDRFGRQLKPGDKLTIEAGSPSYTAPSRSSTSKFGSWNFGRPGDGASGHATTSSTGEGIIARLRLSGALARPPLFLPFYSSPRCRLISSLPRSRSFCRIGNAGELPYQNKQNNSEEGD